MEKRYYCHCGGRFKQVDNIGLDLVYKTQFKCDTCNKQMVLIEDYEEDYLKEAGKK